MKYLSQEYDSNERLRGLFAPFGYVNSAKVMADKRGRPKDYGFVSFADTSVSVKATEALNGMAVGNGQQLLVRQYYSKKEWSALLISKLLIVRPFFRRQLNTFIECQICTERTNLANAVGYGCDHRFCSDCVINCLVTQIEDGMVMALICPDTDCDRRADPTLVQRLVSEQVYARYEQLILKEGTKDMMEIVRQHLNGRLRLLLSTPWSKPCRAFQVYTKIGLSC